VVSSLRKKGSLDSEVDAVGSIYHNLLRLWAET
jgi:predicted 2-oxoglutarate/Fe(II)-dependent dioxygenase YbiX